MKGKPREEVIFRQEKKEAKRNRKRGKKRMLVSCISVSAWNLKSQVKRIFPSQESSSKHELSVLNQGNEQKEGET